MRIHGSDLNVQAASLGAAAGYHAEDVERARRTRQRLSQAAQKLEAGTAEQGEMDAGFLVGEWLGVRHNSALAEDEYTPGPVTGMGGL